MNKLLIYILFILFLLSYHLNAQFNTLRIMTYNIRYANNNPGEEWNLRKDDVC